MANLPRWLVRILYTSRPSVYIIVLGVVSLITIPTLQQIPDQLGLLAWWMRIVGFLLSLSIAATLVYQLTQFVIPPRPTKPPPEKVETAEMPVSEQLSVEKTENGEPEPDADSEPNLEPPRRLSRFARLRIGRQYPGLQHSPPLFEKRRPAIELFLQLDERKYLEGRRLTLIGWRRKREASTLIYGRGLTFLASLYLTILAANTLHQPGPHSGVDVADFIIGILVGCSVITGVRVFYRWARWYYWRLVGLDPNPELGFEAKVVLIDKPRFFPGGGVKALNMSKINNVSSLTAQSDTDYDTPRSIIAGWLGIEWIEIDSLGQKDAEFNWIGPLRNAPQLVSIIDRAMTTARKQE